METRKKGNKMGAKSGVGLKFLQWIIRGIQLACAAIILGIYSYFLAALSNHNLRISNDVRAVEGISGAAVLYTLAGLLLLCCFAGRTFTSLVAIILDVAFVGAFIYVAVANRDGSGSCNGIIETPFGKGPSGETAKGSGGFTTLPSFHTACRLQTACLAVAIIAIFFFIFSILTEVALARHHRKEKRFGPSPANNYTSGYGSHTTGATAAGAGAGAAATSGGLFSRLFHRNRDVDATADENMLPKHTTPGELGGRPDTATGTEDRHSYAPDGYAPPEPHAAELSGTNPYHYVETNHPDYLPPAPKQESGYGYSTVGNAAGYSSSPYRAQSPPLPSQNYRYDDGIYDRV